ncbi:MAG: hypothetical protein QFX35_00285 [Candidatus Verstraetearchaeota archaeon]|nr:hypothetical protein [Candidatus Verstraetearchaeota archaeon]
MGFVVKKPLLQILQSLGFRPADMSSDEAKRSLEEFSKTSGMTITQSQYLKEISLSLLTPAWLVKSFKGTMVNFVGAYDLGFSMIVEFLTGITRILKPPISSYLWIVIPKSQDGVAKTLDILKNIRDRVKEPPITSEEWEAVKPVIEKLSNSGFNIRGLKENLWSSI